MNSCCTPGIMPPDLNRPLVLTMKKGESKGFAFTLYQSGEPQDLSDSEIVFQVRENPEDNGEYLINKTVTTSTTPDIEGLIDQPTEGNFFVFISSAEIANLSTSKPYFLAIYHQKDNVSYCISAADCEMAKFLVLNP